MTLSYAIKEAQALVQRLDDLLDLTVHYPLDDEEINRDLQSNVKEAAESLNNFLH